jgi:hypothetical protein
VVICFWFAIEIIGFADGLPTRVKNAPLNDHGMTRRQFLYRRDQTTTEYIFCTGNILPAHLAISFEKQLNLKQGTLAIRPWSALSFHRRGGRGVIILQQRIALPI